MLVNLPTAGAVELLENTPSREVVHSHSLGLRRRADALPEENIAVPEKLQCLQRNFNQALQEFGEVLQNHAQDILSRNSSFLRICLSYILYPISYSAAVAVVRTLGKKTMLCRNTIRSHTRNDPPWKIRLQNEFSKLRSKLGRLTKYGRGNTARELTFKVADILCPRKVQATTPGEPDEVIDSLSQRLCVLSARLRR